MYRRDRKHAQKQNQIRYTDEVNKVPVQRSFVGTQQNFADQQGVIDDEFEKKRKAIAKKWKAGVKRASSIVKLRKRISAS